MRLDEWQKYIDSQFLEDEPEPASPLPVRAEPAVPMPPAQVEASAAEPTPNPPSETIPPPMPPETTPNSIQNTVTLVVTPPVVPILPSTAQPPRIELLTPIPEQPADPSSSPEVTNRTRRRSQANGTAAYNGRTPNSEASVGEVSANENARLSAPPSPDPNVGLFAPLTGMDADIPEFHRYLPATHSAQSPVGASPPIAHFESVKITDMEMEALTADYEEIADAAGSSTPATAETLRRVPKSRARHARNVKPTNVPSGLSASELWATVPRHVQTLLSLERMEEIEVAQSSYKRPFQEKRHELIERLLDPILSLEDTARLLNVCPTTVRRYTNKGILTYYRKELDRAARIEGEIGAEAEKETRQRRFRLSDILAFLETQQTAVEADRQAERRQQRAENNTPDARQEEARLPAMSEREISAENSVTFRPSEDV